MKKLPAIVGFIFISGMIACSSKPIPAPSKPTATAKVDSIPTVAVAPKINSVEVLLTELPLMRFPLNIAVDSFRNKKTIPLSLNENSPWFSQSMQFREGTKVEAIGKFYSDMKNIGVLFFVASPGEFEDEAGKEEIILSLFNTETGTVESRSLALKGDGMLGSSVMKNNEEGKKFVRLEMAEIKVTLQSFSIEKGKFALKKSSDKKFPSNEKGLKESNLLTKSWLK